MLVMSRTIQAWAVPELTDRDLAVALIKLNNGLTFYVASLFCDGTKAAIQQNVKQLVNRSIRENRELLLMGDTNAHWEVLWNSKSTCPRGRAWEDYLEDKPLAAQNIGDTFTFNTERGQTITVPYQVIYVYL